MQNLKPESNFRVRLFLDTNILIYLVDENSFDNLKNAIQFLSSSDFVDLVTSHYALIEFIQIRKQEHYLRKLVDAKINLTTAFNYHKKFDAKEINFNDIIDEIQYNIKQEIESLENTHFIMSNENVLKQNLFNISKKICLNSKISIYDSLLIASSLSPLSDYIWTNDSDLSEFFQYERLEKLFQEWDLKQPKIENIKKVTSKSGKEFNLVNNEQKKKVEEINILCQEKILEIIKEKNENLYLGELFTKECGSGDIVCFELEKGKKITKDMFFTIIQKDLGNIYHSSKVSEFRNEKENKLILPFIAKSNIKISFKWESISKVSNIKQLKKAGNLLFINPD